MLGKTMGQFEIVDVIGAGGMGEVYRARDTKLDRAVALKVLPAAFAAEPERLARFQREARTLASLNHPNIAALYGVEEADGQPYLIMELVEGQDLFERLAKGAIPLDEALDIARQIADGLEEAHEKNVVHRDLKPANVKVTPDGKTKVLDFGLARAYLGETVDEGDVENSPTITAMMTQKGMILGTAAYMSPEQARGKPVDRRADLWSFGVILWEMLSGKRLFHGETASDTLAAVLRADVPWDDLPPETPQAVRRLLERCLERDPRKRLRDIGEARVRLERWRDDPTTMYDSSTIMEAIVSPRSRWIGAFPWLVTVASLAVAAFAVMSWQSSSGSEEASSTSGSPMWLEISLPGDDMLTEDRAGGVRISPTGDLIAYISDEKIHVRRLGELEPAVLNGTEGAFAFSFSPDGQWLAFAADGVLKRIQVSGGTPIELGEVGTFRGTAWVDKTTLVVAPSINTGLSVVSLEDGSVTELTTLDLEAGERSHRWPAVVPGHRAVLMMCQSVGQNYEDSDIQIVYLDTGERRTVYRRGAYPQFSTTGHLLIARDRTVFAVPFDPELGETQGLAVPVLENVLTSVVNQELDDGSAAYDLAPDGTLLYRSGTRAQAAISRLAWLDIESGLQVAFGEAAAWRQPVLSPDGASVAIARGERGSRSIYLVDLATKIARRLTFEGSDQLGAWSTDSEYVYWVRTSDNGRSMYRQKADGSSPEEKLRDFGSAVFVPVGTTPDNRFLLGHRWIVGGSYDVEMMSLEGPDYEMVSLVNNPRGEYAGGFSPDGRWIAYLDIGPVLSIYVMPYPDTGVRAQVVRDIDRFHGCWWAGDGSALYIRDANGLIRVDLEIRGASILASPPVRLLEEENYRAGSAGTMDLTPDAKRAIVLEPVRLEETESRRSIVFVDNWLPELERRVASSQ